MRKFNAVLSMAIFALFLLHVVMGIFILSGFSEGGTFMGVLSLIMLAAVSVHAVIGAKLTIDTLIAMKKSGTGYLGENKLFWIRRISGFALMLFIVSHVFVFMGHSGADGFRLNLFDTPQLIMSILLVLTLLIHIVTNIRPVMIAMGAKSGKEIITDIILIMSVLMFAAGIAFVVYYAGWRV